MGSWKCENYNIRNRFVIFLISENSLLFIITSMLEQMHYFKLNSNLYFVLI